MTEPERRMTHAEAVLLTRYAKAACPQQQFDQYTPDAWSDLLGDLRFEDCQAGLKKVVQSQPFVSPAEIRTAVKSLRGRRIAEFGPAPIPPRELDDNPQAYREWLASTMEAIGDGRLTKDDPLPGVPAELVSRPMPDLERLLPTVPAARPDKGPAADAERMAQARAELVARPVVPVPEVES